MEAGLSLRELFAELSRTGADPAELLHAAGYGDMPEPLVTEAIVSYAGTAPLEVAEHLAPFAVAHGPVPDPGAAPVGTHSGLSLLASAPTVDDGPADPDLHATADDAVAHTDHPVDHAVDHIDVDPSALDDPAEHPGDDPAGHHGDVTLHDGDVDPAGVDGLDAGHSATASAHAVSSHPAHIDAAHEPAPHLAHGSFGAGHGSEPPADGDVDHGYPSDGDADADHHADAFLAHDHADDVDVHGHDVSDHDPSVTGSEPDATLLDHDDHPDPADLLDGDEPHHA